MAYDRIPKIVATFTYTKAANPLKTKLNGAIFDAIKPYYLALRGVSSYQVKIKITELGGNRWQYYPKVVIVDGSNFTDEEVAQVNAAVDLAVSTLQSQLAAEGATDITVSFRYMTAGT